MNGPKVIISPIICKNEEIYTNLQFDHEKKVKIL